MRRVCVLGASGSGKTTLASRLARRLGIEHIELDALYHGANWTSPEPSEFRMRVQAMTERQTWVIDGGYGAALGDLVPRSADTIVWIDLPLTLTLMRLARRSIQRLVLRTELWNGNRETLGGLLWQRDALLRWTLERHPRLRRELPVLFRTEPYADKVIHHLRSQPAMDRFLEIAS